MLQKKMDKHKSNINLFKDMYMKIPLNQSKLVNGLSSEIQEYNTDSEFS